MSIGVIATLTIQAGKNAEFEAIFSELAAQVNANEEGCLYYALFQSKDSDTEYKVLESYADQAALDAHGASDYFKAAGAKLAPCMAGAPHLEFLNGV